MNETYTEADVDRWASLYSELGSAEKVSRVEVAAAATIRRRLAARGIRLRTGVPSKGRKITEPTVSQVDNFVDLYNATGSSTEVSRATGWSVGCVCKWLRVRGVKLRRR